jgi:hypothetical protein
VLACCAFVLLLTASGCRETADTASVRSTASSHGDVGCDDAIKAISTKGPPTVRFVEGAKSTVEKAELRLLVSALDLAADSTDRPQAKQSIRKLANDYSTFLDEWNSAKVPPITHLLQDTTDLKSVCGD